MRFKLLIISLTFVYGAVTSDTNIENANAWLMSFIDPKESKIDDRNTDLSPAQKCTSHEPGDLECDKKLTQLISEPRPCVTVNNEQGICVKTSLCMKAEPTADPTTQFTLREAEPCGALQSCCLQKNLRNALKPMVSNVHEQCGLSNPGANAFRETSLDGFAEFGEFPWMVALIRKDKENGIWTDKYAGGGALIHPSVVITAAHKVDDYEPSEIKIRAGEWDPSIEITSYPYQERDVSKIIIHENYFKVHAHNNVALLILKSPVDLSDAPHIIVACLAAELPPPGTRCYGMGWGQQSFDSNIEPHQLKKLELPLVEASECERKYKNSKLGSRFSLHRTLTCAGGAVGVDTCVGDGGSPLVCAPPGQSSRYVVVGLVTYGIACGSKLPGAYLKVPEVYDWVGGRLTLEGINKTSFVY